MAEKTSVLLIDDDPGDVQLVRTYLAEREAPFRVEHRHDLASGLARLAEEDHPIGVVLLDLMLSDSHGLETLQRVIEAAPRLPVVVLSGADDRGAALKAVQRGAQDYLTKDNLDGHALSRALQYAVQRRRIQDTLAESEARFRSVTEHAFDAILAADAAGRIRYMNPAAERTFGHRDVDATGLSLGMLLADPEGPDGATPLDRLLVNEPESVLDTVREMRGRRKDGSGFPAEVAVTGWDGHEGRSYSIMVRDVGHRRETEKALADHRYQLATAAQIAHIGAWTWYVDQDEIAWSDEFASIMGAAPEGRHESIDLFLALVHPDDRPRFEAALVACAEDGRPVSVECRIVRPSGVERHVEIRAALFAAKAEEPRRIVGTLQDVTARHESEAALEEYYRQLVKTEKLAALGTLIAGVAHEINNPLAYVKNNEQIIQSLLQRASADGSRGRTDEKTLQARIQKLLATNRTGIERIETIVRSLRQVARPTSGQRAPLDLAELTRETLPVLKPVRTERDVAVVFVEPDFHEEVIGSQGELSQVVLNLVKNAIEATPAEGTVRVSFRRHEGWICLDITDEGAGVPAELSGRIFNPFFTTKSTGTGLGLAISGQVADAHGGFLECGNMPDGGARFTLRLPDKEHAPHEAPATNPMDIRLLGRDTMRPSDHADDDA